MNSNLLNRHSHISGGSLNCGMLGGFSTKIQKLQFNVNSKGFLVLSDVSTGKLYYPSTEDGTFINYTPDQYKSVKYVSDAVDVFPFQLEGSGLGWIGAAISAVGAIGGALIGGRTSKQANQSAERQLQTQLQMQQLAAMQAEREAANKTNWTPILIAGGGGLALLTIVYLVTRR